MTDYKTTLNLPKTDFPMKGNLPQREPERLKQWQEWGIYEQLQQIGADRPKFILHDGPPYANGRIHIGHAVNKILKDIVLKGKTISGYNTPYVPGWDCHGLPIELHVEKKLGKVGNKVSSREFRQACRDYANKQYQLQRDDFIRLGVFGDWQNPYLTMDYQFEADIIRNLATIIDKGHLHRGYKPVHWCTDCGSALAEAEVEYENKNSPAIDVKFNVLDEEAFWQRCDHTPDTHIHGNLSVVIWTTTPWTLPANEAVCLNPHLEYVVVECEREHGTEYLFMAEALLKDAMLRYGVATYHVKAYCRGDAVEGMLLQHPFYERHVPIVLGDHVTTDSGTGCVHTAPGHGLEDYIIGVKYKLPVDHNVASNGCFTDDTPLFAGVHVFKANDAVIDVLKMRGNIVHAEVLDHSYPHCWRHKTPLIFRGTPQWFIGMDQQGLREQALDAIKDIRWIPSWGGERMTDMVSKRPDWCISRQRAWGVPIPVFIHKNTGQLHPNTTELMEKVARIVEKNGIEAWYDLSAEEVLADDAQHYDKLTDVLDVWFDSGSTFACVLQSRPELQFPADLYLEGSDQHRGWFQTSLLASLAATGQAPYKQLLTHGFTVDAQGRKMSKSLGNVIAPEKIFKTLGADVLRLWIAMTDYRAELSISEDILKRTTDVYRRIRNTARFLLANLNGFEPSEHSIQPDKMLCLDRWVVARAKALQQELISNIDNYQFHTYMQKIHHFCNMDLGSFYLDIIKDRQYTCQTDSVARRSCQTALYHIVQALVRWLAPVLCFTADEIWQHIPGEHNQSVFLNTWYEGLFDLDDNEELDHDYWQYMMLVRNAVNKQIEHYRANGTIGSSLEANVTLYAEQDCYDQLNKLGEELRFVLITSQANLQLITDKPEGTVLLDVSGLSKDKAGRKMAFDGLRFSLEPATEQKCERCWHRVSDIGQDKNHPSLCQRCVSNVSGDGEQRQFA